MIHICGITITYARIDFLNESIACFLAQEYPSKSLIVLNTYPRQKLRGEFPNVRIVNCEKRPSSLAEARNMAVEFAPHHAICATLDDDDAILPDHFTSFAKHFEKDIDWVWQSKMLYFENFKPKGIVKGNFNCVAYRKAAFLKAGKFPDGITVGEDRDFVGRLTAKCPGKKVDLTDDEVTFLYAWGQPDGVYHISGLGEDQRNKVSAHTRIEQWTEDRVRRKLIPVGEIVLKPELRHDYPRLVQEFIGKKEVIPPDSTCIVQTGKTGDILNCLPVAKHYSEIEGKPVYFVVSREFASVLDGVSYVRPHVVDFTVHELNRTMQYANQTFARVIKTQIYGHSHKQSTLCASWPQESWRQGRCLDHFHDPAWKLTFDRRDPVRENALCAKLFKTSKPKLITNFTSAQSVPFPNGQTVLAAVSQEFRSKYEVIDIGKVRAERIYDLVGVYEKADVICSIDTSTMHLAAAVDVPLVALVSPSGWLGPQLRYNCSARITYPQATVKAICDAIKAAPEWMQQQKDRARVSAILARPITRTQWKLNLKNVTLWACCWSDDRDHQIQTLRTLRYCNSIIEFNKTVLFSFLPVPALGFDVEAIQIPQLTPESANTFFATTAARLLDADWALSVHTDGMPLNASLWRQEFFDYDYVGASWPDGVTGNGGLCLESRKCLEAKIKLPFIAKTGISYATTFGAFNIVPADAFVCRVHRKLMESMGVKFATMEVALKFSTEELHRERDSWGWHGAKADPVKFARAWKLIEQSERL